MNTTRNDTLALRKNSIRTLTPTELRVVHGGDATGQTKGNGGGVTARRKRV